MAHGPKTERQAFSDHEALQSIVGARVREARIRANLKQSELGALIGSGQSHVFMIEGGQVNITLKTLVKLANTLNVEPIDLLIDENAKIKLASSVIAELSALLQSAKSDLNLIGDHLHKAENLLAAESKNVET